MVTKPTPGATGWNVAVDEVIDIANSVADLPTRVTALEAGGFGDVTEAELAAGLATKAPTSHVHADLLDQATGDNRYILQTNANAFAQADATTTALAGKQPLDGDLTALAGLDSATAGTVASDGAGWVKKTYAQLKTALGLVKGDVGLGNVDNTSDANKPVSTATQTALNAKATTASLATIATSGKLADTTDLTATGAAVGQLLAPTAVSGGVPTSFGLIDPAAALPAALQPPSKLPPLFTGQQIHAGFAAGHGFTVTQGGTAGDNLDDTSDAILGTQSVKLVTDGVGTPKRLDKTTGLSIDLTDRHPVLWVKTDSVAHLQAIEVWFGQSGGFGIAYRLSPWNSTNADGRLENLQVGQWIRLSFPFSTQTLVNTFGTPNRAALTTLRIQVQDDNTGNPVTVRINGIGSMPEPRTVWPNGVVSLTFDDSYDNQYTVAKAKMDQYGFPGVAHTICNIIGTAGRMTVQQLRDAQNQSGWQIAAHAYDIANHNAVGGFPSLDDATLFTEFRRMKQWSIDNGFQDAEHLAYPQGYFSDRVLRMAERFFTTSRSTISRTQETWPPAEPQKLRVRNIVSTTTLANLQAWVDDAYTNAYWLILVAHSIDDISRAGGNSLPIALFGQMIDYIAAKGIPVVTTADAAAGRRLPRGAAASMAPGRANDLFLDGAQATTAGTETYNRLHATQGVAMTSGRERFTRFTPSRDRTISNLSIATGGSAGSGLTLARLGLYLVNPDDSLTLVAATLSDTALGTVASTLYTKALDVGGGLPASYTLRRGQRYAFGVLLIGTTMPTLAGVVPGATGMAGIAPAASHELSGQTDLPTTVGAGSQVVTNNMPWGYLT